MTLQFLYAAFLPAAAGVVADIVNVDKLIGTTCGQQQGSNKMAFDCASSEEKENGTVRVMVHTTLSTTA